MNDPVDVLIIGAGASGAAVAWSLAETKMHILCLEQGGWMNPADYPRTGRDAGPTWCRATPGRPRQAPSRAVARGRRNETPRSGAQASMPLALRQPPALVSLRRR
jgi:choline dehydrogenase-like flavoprotein